MQVIVTVVAEVDAHEWDERFHTGIGARTVEADIERRVRETVVQWLRSIGVADTTAGRTAPGGPG
jgi:hypothetical protein